LSSFCYFFLFFAIFCSIFVPWIKFVARNKYYVDGKDLFHGTNTAPLVPWFKAVNIFSHNANDQTTAMKVTLRKRLIDNDTRYSLRLDIYPPAPHPETGKLTRWHNLGMYLHANPKTSEERKENKDTLAVANAVLSKTQLQLHAGHYGFLVDSAPVDFIKFYEKLLADRKSSPTHYRSWRSTLKYFQEFLQLKPGQPFYFSDLNSKVVDDFRSYLLNRFSNNAAAIYFVHLRTALNYAYRHDFIKKRITEQVQTIRQLQTKIVYLTQEELIKLYQTPCEKPILKAAALFSALTGLRFSDVASLKWEDIGSESSGHCIHFTQKKTRSVNYLPISESAFQILNEAKEITENMTSRTKQHKEELSDKLETGLIFPRIQDLQYHRPTPFFKNWISAAGIEKKVTFHTMRHTYATLLLKANINIKIVSEMLGHADLKTTMIYAHVINESRRQAANAISLEG